MIMDMDSVKKLMIPMVSKWLEGTINRKVIETLKALNLGRFIQTEF